MLSDQEKKARVGWGEERTPTSLVRYNDLLGFASSPQPTR